MADPNKPTEMRSGADVEAVIENSNLPEMGPEHATGTMDDAVEAGLPASFDGQPEMDEAPPAEGITSFEEDEPPAGEYPDMEPIEAASGQMASAQDFQAAQTGDAYLRLHIMVEEGVMTVVDASVVDGSLAESEILTGEMAYQVTIDERRLAAGAFADLQEIHSLAPPDNPELGHHHARLETFDFVARVPRSDVMLEELDRVQVALFRTTKTTEIDDDLTPSPGMTFESAAARRRVAMPETVATLQGIKIDTLPDQSAKALREGLR